jgi:hypothetical protein
MKLANGSQTDMKGAQAMKVKSNIKAGPGINPVQHSE